MSINTDRPWVSAKKILPLWFQFLLVLAAVAGIWGGGWWLIDNSLKFEELPSNLIAARGQFGDKFGALNALFSGFAFAGIIFTILLQAKELHQTKKMLEEQMSDSRGQRFDGTFFQLLGLHNELSSKLSSLSNEGRLAFKSFNERLLRSDKEFMSFIALRKLTDDEIRALADLTSLPNKDERVAANLASFGNRLEQKDISNLTESLNSGRAVCDSYLSDKIDYHELKIKNAYQQAAELHIDEFAHYFRNLYHILKFLNESDLIDETEKIRYARILRSQLSEIELWALFYNSITLINLNGRENLELGCPKMGRLLQKFDMLQNLSSKTHVHPTHIKIFERNNGEANSVKA